MQCNPVFQVITPDYKNCCVCFRSFELLEKLAERCPSVARKLAEPLDE
jgi:hypothetical protein